MTTLINSGNIYRETLDEVVKAASLIDPRSVPTGHPGWVDNSNKAQFERRMAQNLFGHSTPEPHLRPHLRLDMHPAAHHIIKSSGMKFDLNDGEIAGFCDACGPVGHIHFPKPELYRSMEEMYATAFHELGHSTGVPSKLNRESLKNENYHTSWIAKSVEELTAELTAAFISKAVGVFDLKGRAQYVSLWTSNLRNARGHQEHFLLAANQAREASDYLLSRAA